MEKIVREKKPGVGYRPVEVLRVVDVDPASGTITIRAHDVEGRIADFPISWGNDDEIWPYCPSSLPSKSVYPNAALPDKDTAGVLYIADRYCKKARILGGTPKWPSGLGAGHRSAKLLVAPQSLLLRAIELTPNNQVKEGTVDLMNRLHAPRQPIVVGPGPMEVLLTEDGFAEFGVVFPVRSHLASAVEMIEARKDPDGISSSWRVVGECKSLIEAGEWDAGDSLKSTYPGLEEAKALIRRVLDI